MDIDELLDCTLSLPEPWRIAGAELQKDERIVEIQVVHGGLLGACPECSESVAKYDLKPRRWRHLDMWDHQTWITCEIPRVKCRKHGVRQVNVPGPMAGLGSRLSSNARSSTGCSRPA